MSHIRKQKPYGSKMEKFDVVGRSSRRSQSTDKYPQQPTYPQFLKPDIINMKRWNPPIPNIMDKKQRL